MASLPRVLLPSDQRDWVVNFVDGYRRLGWEVTTGVFNFELEACHHDVVHFNWPEELTGWRLPSASQIDEIVARLDRLAPHSRMIATVNNLYPHGQHQNRRWHRLYAALYERAEVIHHFSHASKEAVCREYPSVAGRNHIVRVGFNYDLMLPSAPRDRVAARRAFGFAPDEVVYLCFGSLRSWQEVHLIRDAFARARVARKRLFMVARYLSPASSWALRLKRLRWQFWQRWHRVVRIADYVPDNEVPRIFDAADAVVVVRNNSLTSGVPSLAMTFGRFVIASNVGGIPEYLAGAENLLYDPTSTYSLVEALERAAHTDRETIGAANRRIADGWKWADIILYVPERAATKDVVKKGIRLAIVWYCAPSRDEFSLCHASVS